ncbi:hypothetical protein HYV74_02470 [Candidatus Uhrbacteria bacterium]|nr:hypothetical protein [Candidatus Uhrbacteria bacterium]
MPTESPSATLPMRLDRFLIALAVLRFLEHVHPGDDDAHTISERNPLGCSLTRIRSTLRAHLGADAARRFEEYVAFHCSVRDDTCASLLRTQLDALVYCTVDCAPFLMDLQKNRELLPSDFVLLRKFLTLVASSTITIDHLQRTPTRAAH